MTVQDFTTTLLAHMGVDDAQVAIEESEVGTTVTIQVSDEESGLLIGYHGESLTALQRVLYMVFSREDAEKRFFVDVNGYKARRTVQIQDMAREAAERVMETSQDYVFPFLAASERLVVHEFIANQAEYVGLETLSQGEGQQRRLYIRKKAQE